MKVFHGKYIAVVILMVTSALVPESVSAQLEHGAGDDIVWLAIRNQRAAVLNIYQKSDENYNCKLSLYRRKAGFPPSYERMTLNGVVGSPKAIDVVLEPHEDYPRGYRIWFNDQLLGYCRHLPRASRIAIRFQNLGSILTAGPKTVAAAYITAAKSGDCDAPPDDDMGEEYEVDPPMTNEDPPETISG